MIVLVSIFGAIMAPIIGIMWTFGWYEDDPGWRKGLLSPAYWMGITLMFIFAIGLVSAMSAVAGAFSVMGLYYWFMDNPDPDRAYHVARIWAWAVAVPLNYLAWRVLHALDWFSFSRRTDYDALMLDYSPPSRIEAPLSSRSAKRVNGVLVVAVIACLFAGTALVVAIENRGSSGDAADEQSTTSGLIATLAKKAATTTPSPSPNVEATREARPTPAAPLLSSVFPTATYSNPGKTSEPREKHCPGYSAWVDDWNNRAYRAGVLMNLLEVSSEDDFEGLNLKAMKREVRSLIREEKRSEPPVKLKNMQAENLEWFGIIEDMIDAVEDDDWLGFRLAAKAYDKMLVGKSWLDPDGYISDQCG